MTESNIPKNNINDNYILKYNGDGTFSHDCME
jgi:hypothetical protein